MENGEKCVEKWGKICGKMGQNLWKNEGTSCFPKSGIFGKKGKKALLPQL